MIDDLPNELIDMILYYININDLMNLSKINERFYQIVENFLLPKIKDNFSNIKLSDVRWIHRFSSDCYYIKDLSIVNSSIFGLFVDVWCYRSIYLRYNINYEKDYNYTHHIYYDKNWYYYKNKEKVDIKNIIDFLVNLINNDIQSKISCTQKKYSYLINRMLNTEKFISCKSIKIDGFYNQELKTEFLYPPTHIQRCYCIKHQSNLIKNFLYIFSSLCNNTSLI